MPGIFVRRNFWTRITSVAFCQFVRVILLKFVLKNSISVLAVKVDGEKVSYLLSCCIRAKALIFPSYGVEGILKRSWLFQQGLEIILYVARAASGGEVILQKPNTVWYSTKDVVFLRL